MMSAGDAFSLFRLALEQTGVRYAIGGSWASTALGGPRFTNDVDILADFTRENLDRFLDRLPKTFYADPAEARNAVHLGTTFNVIYMPMAFKFDFFPASAFPLGLEELDRAVFLTGSGLSEAPTPFVHTRGHSACQTALVPRHVVHPDPVAEPTELGSPPCSPQIPTSRSVRAPSCRAWSPSRTSLPTPC